jgi:hypothetical protein
VAMEREGGGQRPNRNNGAWGRCDLQEFRVHENRPQTKASRFFSEKTNDIAWCMHRLLVEAALLGGGPLWQRSQQRYWGLFWPRFCYRKWFEKKTTDPSL